MICIIAFFACIMAVLLLYMKKRDKKYMLVVSVVYALENLIIYYAALDHRMFNCSKIDHNTLLITFFVGVIAWPITKYEIESIMKQK